MRHYLQRNLAQRLETARIATTNASTPAIATALTAAGVLPARVSDGKTIYQAAADKVTAAHARRGDQMVGTDFARQRMRECRTGCQALARVARGVFRGNPGALGILGLDRRMPSDNGGFLLAAQTLLNTTAYTAEMRTALAAYGYNDAKLSLERGKFAELQFALNVQGQNKAAHQQAKAEQFQAVKAMDRWMGMFVRVARVALADKPQLLEQLGIVAPTFPTAAQRAGRVKAATTRLAKKALANQPTPLPKAA
jgi:hypothetical protein